MLHSVSINRGTISKGEIPPSRLEPRISDPAIPVPIEANARLAPKKRGE
jgi:hypothetical protein